MEAINLIIMFHYFQGYLKESNEVYTPCSIKVQHHTKKKVEQKQQIYATKFLWLDN